MKLTNITLFLFTVLTFAGLSACIEDDISTSSAEQPKFSVDTLKLGEVFTLDGSPTKRFTVHNRYDKVMNIGHISMRDDDARMFRLNVDGISGREFSNIEIRPKDSIFVFVEVTLPENNSALPVKLDRHLDFVTNGVTTTVVLNAVGQDVMRCKGLEITSDTRWCAGRPYQIFDTLYIRPGATLTLEAGTTLAMHDASAIKVEGRLVSLGTPQANVNITGDRTGTVASDIPYELMSGQWGGIYFAPTSKDNVLEYTSVRNSTDGLTFARPADTEALTARLTNCQIRNTKNYIIDATHANLQLVGCELADASNGILWLQGGRHIINHCTIANYYLFTALGGPAVQLAHTGIGEDKDDTGLPFTEAQFTNSIIYGNGTDLSHGDLTDSGVYMRNCLLKSAGSDDDHFVNCLWDTDPLYYTVRSEYLFDYRLKEDSPAIGAADTSLDSYGLTADRYGVNGHSDLGAYVFVAPAD